jgi:hypothetical protein
MIRVLFTSTAKFAFFKTNTSKFFDILIFVVVDLVACFASELNEVIL